MSFLFPRAGVSKEVGRFQEDCGGGEWRHSDGTSVSPLTLSAFTEVALYRCIHVHEHVGTRSEVVR